MKELVEKTSVLRFCVEGRREERKGAAGPQVPPTIKEKSLLALACRSLKGVIRRAEQKKKKGS